MQTIADQLRVKLFADRGADIAEAMQYADHIFSTTKQAGACYTALHVVLNTIANAIEEANGEPDPVAKKEINPDPKTAGEQLAKSFKWSGDLITIAFLEALTESNHHSFAREIEAIAITRGVIL